MKRIILTLILSAILTLAVVVSYSIFKFNAGFKSEKLPFDTFLGYGHNIRDTFLKNRLRYRLKPKYTGYDRNAYNMIIIDNPLTYYFQKKKPDEIIGELRKWCGKDRRAVVFYNTMISNGGAADAEGAEGLPADESTDEEIDEDDYYNVFMETASIKVEPHDEMFEGVDQLLLNTECEVEIDRLPHNTGSEIKPLLTSDGKTIIARERINGGEIIYIADYYVFSDKNILKDDNALFLNNLLKKYFKEEIVLDRFADNSIVREKSFIETASFPFIMIQLAILCAVFFLAYFKRFGAPIDRDLYVKRSVVRHLESVGFFFEKCGRDDIMVRIFDQYFMERLLKIIKIRATDEKNFAADLEKRFGLSKDDMKLFYFNNDKNIPDNQVKRERFLRRFKKEKL